MKKVLFLGGAPTQVAAIKYAVDAGYYAITVDYLPSNPGHRISHKYYDVSTTDMGGVLEVARKEGIDGIVAYASDPAAPTAAYVAEKMGLPGNPYRSVEILTRKDLFRDFLARNGFNVPRSKAFDEEKKARAWLEEIGVPAFVKPVDSSGSKGVSCLQSKEDFYQAFHRARDFSREKRVVIETEVVRKGYQVDSDIFMVDGELAFWAWSNQHQDKACNPYAPVAISYPAVLSEALQEKAKSVVGSVLKSLGFRIGAFNVEFVIDPSDEVWIIEIGPRNGGNLIPQVLRYATGVDLIAATVDAALGRSLADVVKKPVVGYWSSVVVHSRKDGRFHRVRLSDRVRKYVVEQNIQLQPGAQVRAFDGAHDTVGTMILQYPDQEEMLDILDNMETEIRVLVD